MDDRYPKTKIYISELRIHTSSIRNNALRDLTLIAMWALAVPVQGVSKLGFLTVIRNKNVTN